MSKESTIETEETLETEDRLRTERSTEKAEEPLPQYMEETLAAFDEWNKDIFPEKPPDKPTAISVDLTPLDTQLEEEGAWSTIETEFSELFLALKRLLHMLKNGATDKELIALLKEETAAAKVRGAKASRRT